MHTVRKATYMRTALLRVGTVVAAALLAAATVTAPAHAEPATLSGTITSESTGEPLAACVTIYTGETFEWIASTCADGSGTWSVTDGIEAGVAYKVEVSGDGTHLGEWADDAPYYWDATAFTAPAVVDVTLAEGAILEGALTDVAGAAAPWAWVSIVGSEYLDYVASTSTDSAGNWSVAVPPGTYKVQFEVDNARSWAFGKTTAADADIVTATAGVPTRVDNQLPETTELTGTITADDTGAPISTCVAIYAVDTYDYAGGGCADDTGHWTAAGLIEGASYKVQVYGQDSYVGEWANDAYSFDAATTFTAPGVVDVGLAVGGVLEGTLTDDGGSPVTWGNVDIFTSDLSSIVASTGTFDTGSWSAVVPAGDYKIQFGAFPGGSSWAFRKATGEEADVVTVTAGGTTRVDDVLGADLPTGTFTGVVTDEQSGEPLEGICVDALGFDYGDDHAPGCSGSDGVYTLEASAGDWMLKFYDESGQYVSEYSGDTTDRAAAEV
ncbi:MAG TPA: carboxypeptidase-like regulatory domain-containing protein, partial [Jiangellaceae bacterium]|nr:carboxypeptidase-like regulatory domain-containing protein [Jiangellaceae bacterium]